MSCSYAPLAAWILFCIFASFPPTAAVHRDSPDPVSAVLAPRAAQPPGPGTLQLLSTGKGSSKSSSVEGLSDDDLARLKTKLNRKSYLGDKCFGIGTCVQTPHGMHDRGYCEVQIRAHRPRLPFQPAKCTCRNDQLCSGEDAVGRNCACPPRTVEPGAAQQPAPLGETPRPPYTGTDTGTKLMWPND